MGNRAIRIVKWFHESGSFGRMYYTESGLPILSSEKSC